VSSTFDKRAVEGRARRALDARQYDEALVHLWQLADRGNVTEDEYRSALKDMTTCARRAHAPLRRGGSTSGIATAFNTACCPSTARAGRREDAARAPRAGWLVRGDPARGRTIWRARARDRPSPIRACATTSTWRAQHLTSAACLRVGSRAGARPSCTHAPLTAAADGFEAKGSASVSDCYGVLLTKEAL
jgi:hypothetical protein